MDNRRWTTAAAGNAGGEADGSVAIAHPQQAPMHVQWMGPCGTGASGEAGAPVRLGMWGMAMSAMAVAMP